ncbi:MAG: hypothetical protein U9N07_02415 [Euryarchaeota archaeon]|nr:hypothetical protein [Euryarchaeota archaeon]
MTKKAMIILFVILALVASVIGSGCVDQGKTVDVGFRDGSYQQYKHVESWNVVEKGVLSDTVDLHFTDGRTLRLHYVTSIDIIEQ